MFQVYVWEACLEHGHPEFQELFSEYGELGGLNLRVRPNVLLELSEQAWAFKGCASSSSLPGLYFQVGDLRGRKLLTRVRWEDLYL